MTWRDAITAALYGPAGFYLAGRHGSEPAGRHGSDAGLPGPPVPAAHFRTSAQIGAGFSRAVLSLLERLDTLLGHPDPIDVVDVGAGGGELLTALHDDASRPLRARLRLTGVDLAGRPQRLPAAIGWRDRLPSAVTGLIVATEWLDNVPFDIAGHDDDGELRYLLVDPASGRQRPGNPLRSADADWLARWWPPVPPGGTVELGRSRDEAWAGAVRALRRGAAVAVDYGHRYAERPPTATVTGFRAGREVPPVPDGSCDITAHVAIDAVAAAGSAAAGGTPYTLLRQRDALRAVGVHGRRPPLRLASTDARGYLAALAAATVDAELTDPAGLGAHWWLIQPVGLAEPGQRLLPGGTGPDAPGPDAPGPDST
ncbi:SAM-dependent methyltransferase [Solwaraspora sp. WMMD406]|uniref:SAM-dependent methyltransferase n=1 Tax=Solwaraspora sp. WMMD406 TaxID=3016095 RepID=UPI0024177ED7|nr:SAM-dependent methyltransferase [Solwaraspora sp. WMMD406]MDG4768444.1 SAM-dependent methyltransferase [Solwaraspora sp. WMMD406]